MTIKKKVFWIAILIIIAAVAIVLCVSYFTGKNPTEFDGTLVKLNIEVPIFLS